MSDPTSMGEPNPATPFQPAPPAAPAFEQTAPPTAPVPVPPPGFAPAAPTFAPAPPAFAPAPPADQQAFAPASAPPGYPVSGLAYPVSAMPGGYLPIPVPPARKSRAGLIFGVLSVLLLVTTGVLATLFILGQGKISDQKTTIDTTSAQLRAKNADLARTEQDLSKVNTDLSDAQKKLSQETPCAAAGHKVATELQKAKFDQDAWQAALTSVYKAC